MQAIPSRVLVIIHPRTSEAESAIQSIRQEFKTRFKQESVLRVTAPSQVAF
ncbi:MAG: DUF3574 domain-containing protein [Verrucomicrobia bacterium]|nr:DUF3574 domain-containing protein [Verrucomicrobiota bacterium]